MACKVVREERIIVSVLLGNIDVGNEERDTEKERTFYGVVLLHETVTNQVNLVK